MSRTATLLSKAILVVACCFGIVRQAEAQTPLISASDGGFENATSTLAANGWTVVNGTSITWFTGTAAGAATGTKAAFVGSSSAVYTGSTVTVIKHFYRDIAIPAGATSVFLNYKLKMPIIDNTFDFFYVYTNTTAQTPVSGTLPAGTQRASYTTPALANFTARPQIDLTSLAGTTVRLVFTYRTDAASPFANPAVDDITLTYIPAAAGCTNASLFPSASFAAPAPGAGAYTIATNQFQSEYNSMTGAVAGHTFTSTGSIAGTYITVRSGTFNGALVAAGTSPLNWTAAAGGAYFTHYNTNSSCGTASASMTSTVTNTSPVPLLGENCTNAQNLALLTSPYAATTVGYTEDISICRTGAPDRIFFISVPNGSQLTIGESTNSYDEYEYVGYGATCPGTTTIQCWDNDGLAQTTWLNNTGSAQTVWYVQDAFTAGGSGTFTLQWTITSPPGCAASPTSPTDGATGIAAAGTTLIWPSVATATGYDVYFGTTNPAPTLVSSNQVATTYATGVLSGSTTYYWRIVPRNAVGAATGCANWSFVTAAGAPSNDNCASAIAIASLPYTSAVIDNTLATDDSPASSCDGPYKNVWWTVPGICGTMTAITCTGGTNFDNEMAVFTSTGGCTGPWTQVTCNDDNGAGCTSNYAGVSWTATVGTTYYITAGSFFNGGSTGNLQLNVTSAPFTASAAPTGISGTTTICAGGVTTLTATGGTVGTGATIEWFTGSCGGTPAGTGTSISVSPGTTTTYYVRYTGTCNTTTCASVVVSVTPLPTVSITPDPAVICAGGSITITATGTPDNSLANVLSAINANSAGLIASIPTPSGFTMDGGVNGTNISDGCSDMYDGGNYINTNLGSAISYSDNAITPSASYGTGGQYFTRYLGPGGCQTGPATLFFWAADINGLSTMSITGNNGADGFGTQDTHSFTVTANGITYTAFLKRVYNATDPSINQLFLIPQPNSASQSIDVTTDNSLQSITGLTGVTRVYYMLYAGASGAFINNTQAESIAQNFVNIIPTSSYVWSPGGETTAAIPVSPGTTTTYTVTYSSQGCSNTATREVTVNPLPIVSCGSYGPVCVDAADIALSGSPTGGTWSGTGVTGDSFDPSAGTQTISYSYTDGNGCSGNCTTTITVNPLPIVSCGSYGPVCVDAADIALGGSPAGGTWSGTGVTGDSFDPSAGTQTVSYSYTDGNGCSANCSTSITVNQLPVVTCGSYGPVCADAADIALSGSPAGGTWSGTGVTGDSFDPSAGTQTVSYSYTDGNGCSASCSTTITVNPLPVVTCGGPYPDQCDTGGPLALTGSPSGGTWSGTAVDGDSFDPSLAGVGSWTLTYTYTDGNGCTASCQTAVTVNAATTWYVDADNDGHGDIDDVGVLACEQPLGTVSSNDDECDNDPLKVETGDCGCGVAETDTDSDGTKDCVDGCPTDPTKVNPGACGCGVPDVDTDGDLAFDCLDGCPSDPNKLAPGACGCGTPDVDSDGDSVLDCNDGCPNDVNKLAPGTCGCGNPEPGSLCDDGNAGTINDMITAGCVCTGTATTPIYTLALTTDGFGDQTSWDISPLGGGTSLCSGSGYASSSTVSPTCALPDGNCYVLTIYDSMMDGMCCVSGTGGYVLRTSGGQRIVDAASNGVFTGSASVALGFCTPIGTDRLTDSRCDRTDYLPNDFVQAIPHPSVQATYGTGNQSDDGYQFWFFNPNGGYSRRVLVTHANSNTIFPVGADRCSYLRMSSITTSPLPLNVLMNVRVRRLVNGVYAEFGPACRFKLDTETNCPTTQLVATAGSTFSCGLSGVLLNGSRTIHAVPVSGANRYQFEFSKPGYLRKLTMTTSSLALTVWNTLPLQYNSTYNVRVRISYDAVVSFCPFGAICTLATAASPSGMSLEEAPAIDTELSEKQELTMWPNPNSDGSVRFNMQGLGEGAHDVSIEIFDLMGARVQSERINLDGEELNTVIELVPSIARGVYVVNVMVDGRLNTERLVVQ